MSELEKLNTPGVESKTDKWAIVAGVAVVVILIVILTLIYSKFHTKKSYANIPPSQKSVNFLGETIQNGSSPDIEIKTVDGYENSYDVATSRNYRSVIANANIKPWNTESGQAWGRGEGFTADEINTIASKGFVEGDDISRGITISDASFNGTPYANDPVSKALIRNSRRIGVEAKFSADTIANKKAADAAAAAKENTFASFVTSKGGLMGVEEPVPYVVVDGKNVPIPGIGGLGYFANYQSTQLTGGSVDAYAQQKKSQVGTYNSKSYYGYDPYSADTEDTLPYANTLFGYRGAPAESGTVVVDITNEIGAEMEDSKIAGQGSNYTKDDLRGIYGGTGYYTDATLLADGIDVTNNIDAIALSGVIVEEAEIEHTKELQKAIDAAALSSSTECNPILIYQKFIGLVDDGDDSTTPQNM